jgi:hypothetical protein
MTTPRTQIRTIFGGDAYLKYLSGNSRTSPVRSLSQVSAAGDGRREVGIWIGGRKKRVNGEREEQIST